MQNGALAAAGFRMRSRSDTEFFDLPPLRVIAHRGASGTYPENTLPAFHAANRIGAPYVELDIHLTREGEVVVIHDEDLRRVAGHEGRIREMTLAEIKQADAGHNFSPIGRTGFPFRGQGIRVPTLLEVFTALPQLRYIVEIKPAAPTIVSATLDVVERTGMSRRVMIVCEHQAPVEAVRRLAPRIPTNLTADEVGAFVLSLPPGSAPYMPHGMALQVPPEHLGWMLVTPESVAAAHRIGIEVHVWTINEVEQMSALIALGVDGIMTDFPERLLQIV